MEQPGQNTDIEIWRKIPDDYYSPAIHVTVNGDIGIKIGGYVLVAPVEKWFTAGEVAFCVPEPVPAIGLFLKKRDEEQVSAQQVTSEILNEDGYIDTLHLGC